MAVRFTRVGSGSGGGGVYDHKELLNIGVRTHEEIDNYLDEIDEARQSFDSLNSRLNHIVNMIGDGGGGITVPGGGEGSGNVTGYLYEVVEVDEDNVDYIVLDNSSYRKGTGELEVFVGGLRQSLGDDYLEMNDYEVKFMSNLYKGDIVVLRVRDRYGLFSPLGFHNEYHITNTDSQELFNTTYQFNPDGKGLEVYVNGLLNSIGVDFTIVNSSLIRFNSPLPKGSLVYIKIMDRSINEHPALIQEKFVTDGSSVRFKLDTFRYRVGRGELEVYLMGIRKTLNVDYDEISPHEFEFRYELPEDLLVVACKENSGSTKYRHYHFYGVEPIGDVDGINTEFILPHVPEEGSVILYVGGVRQRMDNFNVDWNTLYINDAPNAEVFVDYVV